MKIHISSDGTPHGTKITDSDGNTVRARAVRFEHSADERPHAEVDIIDPRFEFEFDGNAEVARHQCACGTIQHDHRTDMITVCGIALSAWRDAERLEYRTVLNELRDVGGTYEVTPLILSDGTKSMVFKKIAPYVHTDPQDNSP